MFDGNKSCPLFSLNIDEFTKRDAIHSSGTRDSRQTSGIPKVPPACLAARLPEVYTDSVRVHLESPVREVEPAAEVIEEFPVFGRFCAKPESGDKPQFGLWDQWPEPFCTARWPPGTVQFACKAWLE